MWNGNEHICTPAHLKFNRTRDWTMYPRRPCASQHRRTPRRDARVPAALPAQVARSRCVLRATLQLCACGVLRHVIFVLALPRCVRA